MTGVPDPGRERPAPCGQEHVALIAASTQDAATPGAPQDRPAVPEPGTLLLVGGGLVGLAISSRRWRRAWASRAAN